MVKSKIPQCKYDRVNCSLFGLAEVFRKYWEGPWAPQKGREEGRVSRGR
jgi:hypothetical protein